MDSTQAPEVYHSEMPNPLFSVQTLLEAELKMCNNPHLTYETIVLRLVKRMLTELNLPWSHVLETVRQGPCVLDAEMHSRLQSVWNHRTRPVTLDEQHCVERVLGHDHNRIGDLMKLGGILNKIADPMIAWHFFAVDGILGDDPKRYIHSFRYGPEDVQYKHVQAVRHLYDTAQIQSPTEMQALLQAIFQQEENVEEGMHGPRDYYLMKVGGWQEVKEIAEWRKEQLEKGKKKRRSSDEDCPTNKVPKTEEKSEEKSEE